MSTYRLEKIFAPRSVALVGASPRDASVGRKILRNLREAGFAGPLHLVNPRHREIDGVVTVPRIDRLEHAPDLVVIAAPPAAIPERGRGRGRERMRRRRHHHGWPRTWAGLTGACGRTGRARTRPAADRSELPRRDGAGRAG